MPATRRHPQSKVAIGLAFSICRRQKRERRPAMTLSRVLASAMRCVGEIVKPEWGANVRAHCRIIDTVVLWPRVARDRELKEIAGCTSAIDKNYVPGELRRFINRGATDPVNTRTLDGPSNPASLWSKPRAFGMLGSLIPSGMFPSRAREFASRTAGRSYRGFGEALQSLVLRGLQQVRAQHELRTARCPYKSCGRAQ